MADLSPVDTFHIGGVEAPDDEPAQLVAGTKTLELDARARHMVAH